MKHELRLFLVALQFLTRVPIPLRVGFDPAWMQNCVRYFPVVGTLIGAWSALVLWVALMLWPPLVASTVSLIATVWFTGAFHEDGLADTFDALGGAVDRERALAIMKDSRIGSYGAVALVLILGLKTVAVAALSNDVTSAVSAVVWSHAASRAAPVFVIRWLPYAGDEQQAKAKPLATRVSGPGALVGAGWIVLLTIVVAMATKTLAVVGASAAFLIATVCMTRWLRTRLGGFTGDTLGATQQIVDAAALLGWLALSGSKHV